jgi:hypothetical protein
MRSTSSVIKATGASLVAKVIKFQGRTLTVTRISPNVPSNGFGCRELHKQVAELAAHVAELTRKLDEGHPVPRGGHGFLDFNRDVRGRNLIEFAEPTPIGWSIIGLRGEPRHVTDLKARGAVIKYRPGLPERGR